jgi:hypothetical protein
MATPCPYGPSLVLTVAILHPSRNSPAAPVASKITCRPAIPEGYGSFDSTCTFEPPEITPFTWTMAGYIGVTGGGGCVEPVEIPSDDD